MYQQLVRNEYGEPMYVENVMDAQEEYDCTGSTEIRIKIQRRGNHFRIIYNESKDV